MSDCKRKNKPHRRIIRELVKGKYVIDSAASQSTNSYYVKLQNGDNKVTLRFSDHPSNRYPRTCLLLDAGFNKQKIRCYVQKRINYLKDISLRNAFRKIETEKAAI